MIAWLMTPLGSKIGGAIGILIIGGLLLRWYGNRRFEAGEETGRGQMAGELQKAVQEARDAAIKETETEREQLLTERDHLQQRINDLSRQRATLQATLDGKLAAIDASLRKDRLDVTTIPAGDLPDRIRAANQLYSARRSN